MTRPRSRAVTDEGTEDVVSISGASSTSGTSSSNPASVLSISGLGTGLDDQQIINQLVAVEQQKVTAVQALGTVEANALGSWSTIRSALSNLTTAEQALVQASDWQLLTGASSDDSVATVPRAAAR